jgi:hypothetical protein
LDERAPIGDFIPQPAEGGKWYRRRMNKTYATGITQSAPTESQVRSKVLHVLTSIVVREQQNLADRLETLHATSFDALQRFDGNLVLLLSKLAGGLGMSTLSSFKDFALSEGNLRDVASLWLATNYGDRLSASGLENLIKSIDREFLNVRRTTVAWMRGSSRLSTSEVDDDGVSRQSTYSTTIAVKPKDYNALMKIVRSAYEWDWFPSMSNTWDAIPLSFVVDWFVNVGDIYRSLDRMVASRYYEVGKVLNGIKSVSTSPLTPGLTYTYYSRQASDQLHLTVDSVRVGLPSVVNCINGGALLLG